MLLFQIDVHTRLNMPLQIWILWRFDEGTQTVCSFNVLKIQFWQFLFLRSSGIRTVLLLTRTIGDQFWWPPTINIHLVMACPSCCVNIVCVESHEMTEWVLHYSKWCSASCSNQFQQAPRAIWARLAATGWSRYSNDYSSNRGQGTVSWEWCYPPSIELQCSWWTHIIWTSFWKHQLSSSVWCWLQLKSNG